MSVTSPWQRSKSNQASWLASNSGSTEAITSGEWQGKAGGYGIQGLAGALIPWISGSFTGIMGLPVAETAALLAAVGYPVWRQE